MLVLQCCHLEDPELCKGASEHEQMLYSQEQGGVFETVQQLCQTRSETMRTKHEQCKKSRFLATFSML
jgi:hypothetical protein